MLSHSASAGNLPALAGIVKGNRFLGAPEIRYRRVMRTVRSLALAFSVGLVAVVTLPTIAHAQSDDDKNIARAMGQEGQAALGGGLQAAADVALRGLLHGPGEAGGLLGHGLDQEVEAVDVGHAGGADFRSHGRRRWIRSMDFAFFPSASISTA